MEIVRTCWVPGCEDRHSKRHRFPSNKKAQQIWIQRIGNPYLARVKKLGNTFICEKHFTPFCTDNNGRLVRYALPTIGLSGFTEEPTKENSFLYLTSQVKRTEQIQDIVKQECDNFVPPSPSENTVRSKTPDILKEALQAFETGSRVTISSPLVRFSEKTKRVYSKRLFSDCERSSPTTSIMLGTCGVVDQSDNASPLRGTVTSRDENLYSDEAFCSYITAALADLPKSKKNFAKLKIIQILNEASEH